MALTRAERRKLVNLGTYTKTICNICGKDITHNDNITMHYLAGDRKHKEFFNLVARPNSRVEIKDIK